MSDKEPGSHWDDFWAQQNRLIDRSNKRSEAIKKYEGSKEILKEESLKLMNDYYLKANLLMLKASQSGNEKDKEKFIKEARRNYMEVVEIWNEFGLFKEEVVQKALKKLEKMKEDFINDEIITFYLQAQNYELMVNHTEAIKWYKKIVNYGDTFKDEINDYSRNIIKMSQESLSKLEKEDNNKK